MNTDTLRPVRCAIHVHSDYGDGHRPVEEIAEAARAAGVEALFLTDHHEAHAARDGWEGVHDGLRIVVGAELNTRRHHLLAFGLHERVGTRRHETDSALRLLHRLRATVFLPHPQGHRCMGLFHRRHIFADWQQPGFAGLEIWGYLHDWVEQVRLWRLPAMVRDPDPWLRGPEPAVLAAWDALARKRRVSGIGGLDNHACDLPFGLGRLLGWARGGVLPHEQCFRSFATYALAPPPENQTPRDAAALLDALAQGRAWTCHDALGSGRAFRFELLLGERVDPVGTETAFLPGMRLRVRLPGAEAGDAIRLLCRGETLCEGPPGADHLEVDAPGPGEYRVEVRRDGRPWIFSNHLYLRNA